MFKQLRFSLGFGWETPDQDRRQLYYSNTVSENPKERPKKNSFCLFCFQNGAPEVRLCNRNWKQNRQKEFFFGRSL